MTISTPPTPPLRSRSRARIMATAAGCVLASLTFTACGGDDAPESAASTTPPAVAGASPTSTPDEGCERLTTELATELLGAGTTDKEANVSITGDCQRIFTGKNRGASLIISRFDDESLKENPASAAALVVDVSGKTVKDAFADALKTEVGKGTPRRAVNGIGDGAFLGAERSGGWTTVNLTWLEGEQAFTLAWTTEESAKDAKAKISDLGRKIAGA